MVLTYSYLPFVLLPGNQYKRYKELQAVRKKGLAKREEKLNQREKIVKESSDGRYLVNARDAYSEISREVEPVVFRERDRINKQLKELGCSDDKAPAGLSIQSEHRYFRLITD